MESQTPPRRVLLVEGQDDESLVSALLRKHTLKPNFEISNKRGFNKLREAIPAELNVSGREAIGILTDAN